MFLSHAQDLPYVAQYSYYVSLDMVIANQPTSPDPVYVSLQVKCEAAISWYRLIFAWLVGQSSKRSAQ